MHPGKCSFCWAGRRCLTKEARSTWVEVLQNPNLFRPTKEDRLAQLQCTGVQLLQDLGPVEGVGSQGWRMEGRGSSSTGAHCKDMVQPRGLGLVNHQHPPMRRRDRGYLVSHS